MPNKSRAYFTPATIPAVVPSPPTTYGFFSREGLFTAPIATNGYAEFGTVGPNAGGVVPAAGPSIIAFVLPLPGDYDVSFALNVPEQPGGWLIELTDGGPAANQPQTLAGGATATSTVAQRAIIRTTTPGATIRLKNISSGAIQLAVPGINAPEDSTATLAIVRVG